MANGGGEEEVSGAMLLARMADAVYWAGRYLERAEDMARVVAVHGETHIDLPVGEDVGWWPLIEITGAASEFRAAALGRPAPAEGQVVDFVLVDRDNPASILSSIAAARANLRRARPVVPREVWELCNELWMASSLDAHHVGNRGARVRWLRRVVERCAQIGGVVEHTMRRDDALAFLRIGQQLERADLTCRTLSVHAETALPPDGGDVYTEVHRMALLRSLASYQPYRRVMPARADGGSILRFLLQDEASPRAVGACLAEVRTLLKGLPRNEPVVAAATEAAVRVGDAPLGQLTPPALRAYLHELEKGIADVHDHLDTVYFMRSVSPPRSGSRISGPRGSHEHPSNSAGATRPGSPARPTGPAGWAPVPGRVTSPAGADRASSPAAGGGRGKMTPVGGRKAYRVVHRTAYEYDAPVRYASNEAHLTPRSGDRQWCVAHEISVDPLPTTRNECTDLFGNSMVSFVVEGGFESMTVTATSEVVVARPAPPPSGPPWESVARLLEIDRQPSAREARRFRSASRLVPISETLAEYAAPSFPAGRPMLEAVLDLAGRIYREFAYEPGFTSISTPPLEVLEHRRGVCQDFAHLAIGCLRALGLSARYVSGYIETVSPTEGRQLVGADASHAWISVFLPGWGWVDVDPTNDRLVGDEHITTAWGRDYFDVSPLRGSVDGGGPSQRLEVAVEVTRLAPELAAG